ncbi:MAG: hypothetical protein FE048_00190 [Thermoplasmata archaeon]|nr:MAG: hypothetical protein FE048_00190 [Thermoplasmata archaeon]
MIKCREEEDLDGLDGGAGQEIPIHFADGFHGCHDGGGACTCQYLHGQHIQDIPIGIHTMEWGIDTRIEYIRR